MKTSRLSAGRLSGILIAVAAGLLGAGCAAKSQGIGSAQLANRIATYHPTVVQVTGSVVQVEPRAAMSGVPMPFFAFIHGVEYSRYIYWVAGVKGEAEVAVRVTTRRGQCVSAEWMVNGQEYSGKTDEILAETGPPITDSPPAGEDPPEARVE